KEGSIGGGLQKSKANAFRGHDDKYYCDRFYWQNTWGKFTSKFFYEKTMELDYGLFGSLDYVDADYDIFWFKEHYDWKGGGVWLNYTYYNEAWNWFTTVPSMDYRETEHLIRVAGYQAFGPLTLGAYVSYYFGDRDYDDGSSKDIKNFEWYFTAE
ncbi:MAG: hypothetical protein JRF41_02825, partial [Deltaproteobacteria bacterium]|nr:hypothetical protein [Deltaproteobacteria bacterium]